MADVFDERGLALTDCNVVVCNYNAAGEYLSTTSELIPRGVGLPANATLLPAPAERAGYGRVFNGGSWSYVEDHRGTVVYSLKTRAAHTIMALGSIDTALYSTQKPAPVPATLKVRAAQALSTAASTTWVKFGSRGNAVPQSWIDYQNALAAIVDGTDTTSTELPQEPVI